MYRSSLALSELDPSVGTGDHPVFGEWTGNDGWRIVHVRHDGHPFEYERPWLERIATATGSSVLVCNIFESYVARLRGAGIAGFWDGWLDPGAVAHSLVGSWLQNLANDVGEDPFYVGGEFGNQQMYDALVGEVQAALDRARPGLAEAVVVWARDAGCAVAVENVVRHLEGRREPHAQADFFELLDLIGVSGSTPD